LSTKKTASFELRLARQIVWRGQTLSRADYLEQLWGSPLGVGLQGVHEGTLLAEEAHAQGFETESFTVDAGEAPRERDWISSQVFAQVVFYYEDLAHAEQALASLKRGIIAADAQGIDPSQSQVVEIEPQDWDAEWKKSFKGIDIEDSWRVLPPWENPELKAGVMGDSQSLRRLMRLNPGAGFGTGTHETTQLCLLRLSDVARANHGTLAGKQILDFGSGSGILSIGAALLGAHVTAVEIDPLANDNAAQNAGLNDLEFEIRETLKGSEIKYDGVIANILKPVLLEFAPQLIERLKPQGFVLLSGLVQDDVAPVIARFESCGVRKHCADAQARVYERGEWRAILWAAN
jgi:ribosomal protein L11 methyltransferase